MNCHKAEQYFDEFHSLGNRFSDPLIEKHVETCISCSKKYEQWQQHARLLESTPVLPEPPGLTQEILSLCDKPARAPSAFPSRPLFFPRPALTAVVSLLVIAASIWFYEKNVPERHGTVWTASSSKIVLTGKFPSAKSVSVAGDFNQWDIGNKPLRKGSNGNWIIELELPPGTYQYQFVVNGNQWHPDPSNPVLIPDGFGGYNSGIEL
ncbi:MAG: hypothetical protein GF401_20425 [Chitinivibrionales bacterium]|nr:hypothetical protein [Chitinivibrionales bacterium]